MLPEVILTHPLLVQPVPIILNLTCPVLQCALVMKALCGPITIPQKTVLVSNPRPGPLVYTYLADFHAFIALVLSLSYLYSINFIVLGGLVYCYQEVE